MSQPIVCLKKHRKRVPVYVRFYNAVIDNGKSECWGWRYCKDKDGYGLITVPMPDRKSGFGSARANRVSWEIHYGPIPDGKMVLHRCDNPECSNPIHLFLGDSQLNVDDMILKNRHRVQCGELHHNSKITSELALSIRNEYDSHVNKKRGLQRRIAEKYGVNPRHVNKIIKGLLWRCAQ